MWLVLTMYGDGYDGCDDGSDSVNSDGDIGGIVDGGEWY